MLKIHNWNAVAKALDNIKLYGLFVRCDSDGDGIPDDVDNNSCERTIPDVTVSKGCQGEDVTITVTGLEGTKLQIALSDPKVPEHQYKYMVYVPSPGAGQPAEQRTLEKVEASRPPPFL